MLLSYVGRKKFNAKLVYNFLFAWRIGLALNMLIIYKLRKNECQPFFVIDYRISVGIIKKTSLPYLRVDSLNNVTGAAKML